MTDENLSAAVAEEMRLARSALQAADALLGMRLFPDAARRAYDAAVHAARALLRTLGIEPGSHDGVGALVVRHFVRPDGLSPERSTHLQQLESLRSASDDPAFALGVAELAPEIEKARGFVEDCARILRAGGYLTA